MVILFCTDSVNRLAVIPYVVPYYRGVVHSGPGIPSLAIDLWPCENGRATLSCPPRFQSRNHLVVRLKSIVAGYFPSARIPVSVYFFRIEQVGAPSLPPPPTPEVTPIPPELERQTISCRLFGC